MAKKNNTKKSTTSNFKKGRLSNKDFDIFKANIHMSDEQLGKKLKRPESFIAKTRQRVYPNKKTGKWTASEMDSLTINKEKMSVEELARLLNRSEKTVKTKLTSLEKKETKANEVIEDVAKKLFTKVEEKECCDKEDCDKCEEPVTEKTDLQTEEPIDSDSIKEESVTAIVSDIKEEKKPWWKMIWEWILQIIAIFKKK